MVPSGWLKFNLGKILSFKNGINAEKEDYGHGVKFINVMDVFRSKRLYEQSIIGLVNISEKKLNEFSVQYGDILFNRTSETFKEIAFASVYLDTETITFGGFVIRGRPQDEFLYPEYSVYCFQASNIRKQLISKGQGAVRANIGQKDLNKINLSLPPLPEQKKIATILSTWDKAISTTEALIDNSKQQKKALMQQLLTGKKRFPGFEGEWNRVELGKLLDYNQPTPYLVKSTDYSNEHQVPVLTAGKKFVLGYTNENFGIFNKNLPVIIFDDFTTASKFVDFPFKAKSSAMKILVAKKGISIKYLFEAMQILNYPIGGHQRHWISIFTNLVIGLPSSEEQQKIASVLTNADKEVNLLEQQLSDFKQEKKALMQQLLTGKRRVKVDGIEAEMT